MKPIRKREDSNGQNLINGALYLGYRPGLYRLIEVGEDISMVMKIQSGRGVQIRKPQVRKMGNGWLRYWDSPKNHAQ